ncbi:MAG: sugar phosphate isomerase/epimerase [Eubacteriales bacterium]
MFCGMSTACFIGKYFTEESIDAMASIGVKDVEIFLSCPSEYKIKFIKNLKKRLDDNGMRAHSVHAFSVGFEPQIFSIYERSRKDAFNYFMKIVKAANCLGATMYSFHGPANYKGNLELYINYKACADKTRKLIDAAADYGVSLAWENVYWCAFSNPGFVEKMDANGYLDNLRFTLDIKQAAQSGISVDKYIDAMGDRLANIHICDFRYTDKGVEPCLPFTGEMDFLKFKNKLKEVNYTGGLITEVYGRNYHDLDELKHTYDRVKSFFEE